MVLHWTNYDTADSWCQACSRSLPLAQGTPTPWRNPVMSSIKKESESCHYCSPPDQNLRKWLRPVVFNPLGPMRRLCTGAPLTSGPGSSGTLATGSQLGGVTGDFPIGGFGGSENCWMEIAENRIQTEKSHVALHEAGPKHTQCCSGWVSFIFQFKNAGAGML